MPEPDTIRSFIAVELQKPVQDALQKIQEQLKTCHPDVKWVKPANIHLTLKFLGEAPGARIQTVKDQLPSWVAGVSPFSITLNTLGAFPHIRQPRVIWAGLQEGPSSPLFLLAGTIEKETHRLGFAQEKKAFTAHVTIGRIRSAHNIKPLAEILAQCKVPANLTQTVQSVSLLKSTLTPQGPIYDIVSTVSL
ncbi:MAG TPA: RNA 2',3'-cyclic phosphodiesterase [Candidatus Omnitrophota bacterium]|nr:RNA 2',3'-cyclic phosphodiesterase [Candidatus Omnitrophota bacterium]HPB67698.1 RNA 2',3'-cyclic phosphodiesterase [Candidatus Omnitrophota bacterium]HQO58312.1 RNA 2',3'-cyclic phosphodiesterase [Candidatus Omnitrophota bacterium]HQP12348.1 RNA 2',3'-cyclic phosphodiesterase [Candidatus Omnitrophota bacterium]